MKKLCILLVALLVSFNLTACGSSPSGGTPDGDAAHGTTAGNTDKSQQFGEGTLDKYAVKFTDAVLATDYEGHDAIVISYDYTNNDEDAASAMVALYIKAFQDGVELEHAYGIQGVEYNSDNETKDLKTGATLNCQTAFVLTSASPVEVEATAAFSFSSDKVTYTYQITE